MVERVGEGVTRVRAGDRVAYAMVPGAYAEYAAVPEEKLVVLPDGALTIFGSTPAVCT